MLDQDLDQPATRRDLRAFGASLREEIHAGDAALREEMRGEMRASNAALRDEMHAGDAALRDEMRAGNVALESSLRGELRTLEERMARRFDELRTHFELTAENFRAEFRNLYDWTLATTSSLGARLDHVEQNHGTRLLSVETRVTRLERRRKSNRG